MTWLTRSAPRYDRVGFGSPSLARLGPPGMSAYPAIADKNCRVPEPSVAATSSASSLASLSAVCKFGYLRKGSLNLRPSSTARLLRTPSVYAADLLAVAHHLDVIGFSPWVKAMVGAGSERVSTPASFMTHYFATIPPNRELKTNDNKQEAQVGRCTRETIRRIPSISASSANDHVRSMRRLVICARVERIPG